MCRNRTKKSRHEVTFYTYPKFIFVWPLIVLGYVLWFLSEQPGICNETLAWVWGISLLIVLATLGFDLNRNYTVFWLVLIGGLWFMVIWLRDVKSVRIFSMIYEFFADLNPSYCSGLGLLVSIVLSVLYVVMWVWTRLNCRWRITHNEFEHYQFGRMDDSLARGAKRIRTNYPDFFELFICLAGDLVIYDASGRKMLRRIPHVPFLPLLKRRINRIVEMTAVTAGELDDEFADDIDEGGVADDEDRPL